MEILDFGAFDTPELGTEMIFHPIGKKSYRAIVVRVNGNLVTVERIEEDEI